MKLTPFDLARFQHFFTSSPRWASRWTGAFLCWLSANRTVAATHQPADDRCHRALVRQLLTRGTRQVYEALGTPFNDFCRRALDVLPASYEETRGSADLVAPVCWPAQAQAWLAHMERLKTIRDLEPSRHYAAVVAVIRDSCATLIGEFIYLHDRFMVSPFSKAKRNHADCFQRSGKAINDKLRLSCALAVRSRKLSIRAATRCRHQGDHSLECIQRKQH